MSDTTTTPTDTVGSISSLQNMGYSLWTDPINNGVVFQFPNSFCLSVRWGFMNYCSNADHTRKWDDKNSNVLMSKTAEVAILDPSGDVVGDVVGHVTPVQLIEWMMRAATCSQKP